MDFGIAGKTAFVVGGSQGIGGAAAAQLGREGCKVAIVARRQGPIDEAVAAIKAAGGTAVGIPGDVQTKEGVARALATCRDAFGDPEIVVGQGNDKRHASFWDSEDETFVEVFRNFTMSTIYLARETLPFMRKNKWGRFVHIGSGTAKEPETRFDHALANVARPSTIGLLKTLVDDVAADGVTINTVAPGWIHTPAVDGLFASKGMTVEEGKQWLRDTMRIPAGRAGDPQEIASLVTYLCSVPAGYINGCWFHVDGGKHRSIF